MSGSNPLVYQARNMASGNPLASDGTATPTDPTDFTAKYNTPLSALERQQYLAWLGQKGMNPATASYDYDMQGAFKSGAARSDNGHFPDTFKKPNHPTFSDQSQYHGVDGFQGGTWGGGGGQPWSFTPGATNLKMQSPNELRRYFQRVEPDSTLILPEE